MANFIPKIEWLNLSLTGDTNSNTTVDGIADTTGVEVGMFIEGTDIPAGTTVDSFTATTITLSAAATGTTSSVSLSLGKRVTFLLPPEGDNLRTRQRANVRRTISTGGVAQHQYNYTEEAITPNFVFIGQSLHDEIETFMQEHGIRGEEFRYYESNDESTYWDVTLDRFEFRPRRVIPDGSGGFIYDIPLSMRRTL